MTSGDGGQVGWVVEGWLGGPRGWTPRLAAGWLAVGVESSLKLAIVRQMA